jgi:hypothetical protein
VFTRTGAVVAVAGDYAATEVTNDSGVVGATVADALDTLDSAVAPVASVFTRTGAVVAVAGDYAATEVTNDSGVAGATVAAALDTLDATVIGSSSYFSLYSNTTNTQVLADDVPEPIEVSLTRTFESVGFSVAAALVGPITFDFAGSHRCQVAWTGCLEETLSCNLEVQFVHNGTPVGPRIQWLIRDIGALDERDFITFQHQLTIATGDTLWIEIERTDGSLTFDWLSHGLTGFLLT